MALFVVPARICVPGRQKERKHYIESRLRLACITSVKNSIYNTLTYYIFVMVDSESSWADLIPHDPGGFTLEIFQNNKVVFATSRG